MSNPVSTDNIAAMLTPLKASIGGGSLASIPLSGSSTTPALTEGDIKTAALGSGSFDAGVPWVTYEGGVLTIKEPGIYAIGTNAVTVNYSISSRNFSGGEVSYRLGNMTLASVNRGSDDLAGSVTISSLFAANAAKVGNANGVIVAKGSVKLQLGFKADYFTDDSKQVTVTFTPSGSVKVYKL